jgi:hypothetical protein
MRHSAAEESRADSHHCGTRLFCAGIQLSNSFFELKALKIVPLYRLLDLESVCSTNLTPLVFSRGTA